MTMMTIEYREAQKVFVVASLVLACFKIIVSRHTHTRQETCNKLMTKDATNHT